MPTLSINGQSVEVGEDFLNLPEDQQHATVENIAKSLGKKPERTWGDTAMDTGQFLMTAGIRGLTGAADAITDPLAPLRRLISPDLERLEQSGRPHPGQAVGDAAFDLTGVPEYKPTTPGGRVGLATAEGGVAGGPLGVGAAALGALSGMFGQGTQELTGNERLATAAGLAPGVAAGGVAAVRRPTLEPPSATALRDAGGAGYDAVRASGLEINPNAVSELGVRLQNDLTRQGFGSKVAPSTHAILDEIANPPALESGARRVATINDIMALRQNLGNISGVPQDAAAGGMAKRAVDNFLESLDPASVEAGAGSPAAIAETYRNANANYAAAQRSNDLTGTLDRATTGIGERAEGRAQASHSGRNIDNSIRQKTESLLERPRDIGGFSDAEIAALERVRDGGPVRNAARYWGNFLGGGGGLGQSIIAGMGAGVGGAAGGGFGAVAGAAAPAAVGASLRSLANSLARRSLRQADETVRSRSPLAEELALLPQPSRAGPAFTGLLPSLLSPPPRRGLLDY